MRREIAEIQKLNLEYFQSPRPHATATADYERRGQRLRETMDELKSMADWKQT